jgi:hypothetical protein
VEIVRGCDEEENCLLSPVSDTLGHSFATSNNSNLNTIFISSASDPHSSTGADTAALTAAAVAFSTFTTFNTATALHARA